MDLNLTEAIKQPNKNITEFSKGCKSPTINFISAYFTGGRADNYSVQNLVAQHYLHTAIYIYTHPNSISSSPPNQRTNLSFTWPGNWREGGQISPRPANGWLSTYDNPFCRLCHLTHTHNIQVAWFALLWVLSKDPNESENRVIKWRGHGLRKPYM